MSESKEKFKTFEMSESTMNNTTIFNEMNAEEIGGTRCGEKAMNTPEYILQKIRQRNYVDIQDKSNDEEFNNMTPLEKLRDVTGWELGGPSLADQFLEWAKDCGFEIKEKQ